MIDLTGRVALVTGSSRGIGRATALRLAEAGADIIVNYVSSKAEALRTAADVVRLGRRVWVVRADVAEQQDVEQMCRFIEQEVGRLDILVSNAATGGFRPLMDASSRQFAAAMNANVMALLHLVQQAMPLLERSPGRGKVVALSSHGAKMALPMYGLIGGSKAALESIARHLALEVGDRGVNVNVVCAGLVDTESTRRMPGADRMFEGRIKKTMVGERQLEARDVADVVLFLASPLADLVQAETLTVDGGAAVHV